MAICILTSVLSVMGWFLILVVFILLFTALLYGFYYESSMGIVAFIVIPVVYGLCFLGLYALVMQSETMAPVREAVSYRLLTALVLYAAFPISMIVLALLYESLESVGTPKGTFCDNATPETFHEENNTSEKETGCLKNTFIQKCKNAFQGQKNQ